jgi:nucleotide-binding universal stress UspA family protein
MLDEWRETTHAMLEPTATELKQAGIEASIEVLEGSPAELLMSVAEPGDLYVMTSHGRRGATRWVLGSVAEKLVRSAPAPVCLVPARVPSSNTPGQESPTNLAPTP